MSRRALIAIDGPAGVGKSTLARSLARAFDLPYLNTGLMYRAVTLAALRRGVDPEDEAGLADVAKGLRFDLDTKVRPAELAIDGRTPDPALSSSEVESTVSRVARHPKVRAVLRAEQQRLAEAGGVVEGRDIGTVVAPQADVKIFLSAAEHERVARRLGERGAGEDVASSLAARDALDATTNPLQPAEDAVPIDTSRMSAEAVLACALDVVRDRLGGEGP